MSGGKVKDGWQNNLLEELNMILRLRSSSSIAIDAEFPSFLRSTPRWASEEERYQDLKYNVDNLKLIQLGLTLFDDTTSSCYSWQFNRGDFDPAVDQKSQPSIDLLRKSGIDFEKFHREGEDADALASLLPGSLFRSSCQGRTKLITFQGLYDVAYLIKLITRAPLPITLDGFLDLIHRVLGGQVYDIKYMMKRSCEGRSLSELGLVRLSKQLGVEWERKNHLAGHDSLLTAQVFMEMRKKIFDDDQMKEGEHAGVLYSIETHCVEARKRMMDMVAVR